MTQVDTDLLRSIDAKLGALVALQLDEFLRSTGVAQPKKRSIDLLLSDAGLTPKVIAALLGKTDRAVQLQLQKERKKKSSRSQSRKRTSASR